jgi:hypothetical protein
MAMLGIGTIAPLVAFAVSGPAVSLILLVVVGCFLASVGLHLLARNILEGLEE